ncbi:beta-ketoacyl synthase N-terminal-like domain-containing protein [Bacillus velezensis]
MFWSHYELFGAEITQRGTPLSMGVTPASVPNIVSHCLNFTGPSMAVDTMCSSSLTSIHLACESIKRGVRIRHCLAVLMRSHIRINMRFGECRISVFRRRLQKLRRRR